MTASSTGGSAPAHRLVVGIGASAGGLDAFRRFFQHMPADTGIAFVLVQHLDPRHPSIVPELLAAHTPMPVRHATDGIAVEPNSVYVIEPNAVLTIHEGVLRVETPVPPTGQRMPIDAFFTSLARDCGPEAAAIVLCGLGADGTAGLMAVRDTGGLTLVQNPELALHPDMPRSAIRSGAVDQVAEAEAMPALLIEHARRVTHLLSGKPWRRSIEEIAGRLPEICSVLRRRTGHDFSCYKQSTILRRVHRRMQVLRLGSAEAYLQQLAQDPGEAEQLFNDLLINVTRFFRDAEAFELLAEQVIPAILGGKGRDGHVRVWAPGCASGEEAYSIAMLIQEQASRMECPPHVQIFASDIDEEMLAIARHGRYPEGIAGQVSAGRLARFFIRQGASYQVVKELRDMCLFSKHDVVRDPPFSGLDLISCRNLLIYMEGELQKKLVPLFHYALNPGGYLFLGASESVAAHLDLFQSMDKKQRVYRRRDTVIRPAVEFPVTRPARAAVSPPAPSRPPLSPEQTATRTVERVLLEHYAPPGVVVNERGEIAYFMGRLDKYLTLHAGVPSAGLLDMVRESLRTDLRSALHLAVRTRREVMREKVALDTGTGVQPVILIVRPMAELGRDAGLFLVIFQDAGGLRTWQQAGAEGLAPRSDDSVLQQLENELRTTREHLQVTVEDLEAANEALTSSNEELISMNEELQSANEELQTSKEEVQSVNEELNSVNDELNRKIEELNRANNDLQNLFQSTQIATIFLDRELRITRYTPASRDVFRLIGSDVGRPIMDIAPRFLDGDVAAEVRQVLETMRAIERPVQLPDGRTWFIMRILPYRTQENTIDGVVLTFADITEIKASEAEIRSLARFPQENPNPVMRSAGDGRVLYANRPACELLAELGWTDGSCLPEPLCGAVPRVVAEARPLELELASPSGRTFLITLAPGGGEGHINLYGRDITERKRAEKALQELNAKLDAQTRRFGAMLSSIRDYVYVFDADGRFVYANQALLDLWGLSAGQALGKTMRELDYPPEVERELWEGAQRVIATGQMVRNETHYTSPTGTTGIYENMLSPVPGPEGGVELVAGASRDITERKRAEAELDRSRRWLERIASTTPDIIFVLDIVNSRNVYANRSLLEVLGYTPEEFREYDQILEKAIDPADLARATEFYRSMANARPGEVRTLTHRAIRKDGSVCWLENRVTPFAGDESGRLTEVIGISSDVTERLRAEEALRDSESFYRQTLESIPGMVFTTRPDGYCDYQSQQWVEYTGVPMSEHLGDGWNRLLHPDDRPRAFAAWRAAVEGIAPYDLEYRVRRHDGQYEWFKVIGRPIRDAQGQIVRWFGTAVNIERLKRTEDEIEAAKRAAEEASKAKDHFLAVLSHELRTPLTAVLPALGVLDRLVPPEAREYLEMARRNVELEARLIDDLLDVTRIARGKVELDIRPVDLGMVLHRAAEVCAPDIEARRLHFGIELEDQASYMVQADAARLQQVFWNLIKNAVKFTPHGGCVGVRVGREGGRAVVQVIDSGIGIEPDAMLRLFNVFEQADRSITRQFGGLGLGLAISRTIVEMHGGVIRAHSEGKDRGATFTVELPLITNEAVKACDGRMKEHPSAAAAPAQPLRILLVEDHGDTARIMRQLLRAEGHQVTHAGDVMTALELADAEPFDILLSDLGLPDGTGHDLMCQLRQRGSQLRGIALSGYGMAADVQKSHEAGFAEHVTKPVDLPKLLAALNRLAAGK